MMHWFLLSECILLRVVLAFGMRFLIVVTKVWFEHGLLLVTAYWLLFIVLFYTHCMYQKLSGLRGFNDSLLFLAFLALFLVLFLLSLVVSHKSPVFLICRVIPLVIISHQVLPTVFATFRIISTFLIVVFFDFSMFLLSDLDNGLVLRGLFLYSTFTWHFVIVAIVVRVLLYGLLLHRFPLRKHNRLDLPDQVVYVWNRGKIRS